MTQENVKESVSRERVSRRRLQAGLEREKEERKCLSVKHSEIVTDLKRDIEQLMVELNEEKTARVRDVKGSISLNCK